MSTEKSYKYSDIVQVDSSVDTFINIDLKRDELQHYVDKNQEISEFWATFCSIKKKVQGNCSGAIMGPTDKPGGRPNYISWYKKEAENLSSFSSTDFHPWDSIGHTNFISWIAVPQNLSPLLGVKIFALTNVMVEHDFVPPFTAYDIINS
jgi:hypothetical protein